MSVELDLRVHKEVFLLPSPAELEDLPSYTSSIDDAWRIVERLEEEGWNLHELHRRVDRGGWWCKMFPIDGTFWNRMLTGIGETAPLAIVDVALGVRALQVRHETTAKI